MTLFLSISFKNNHCLKEQTAAKNKVWAQLGLNQRPLDYESSATNRLSYGPDLCYSFFEIGLQIYNFVSKLQKNTL